MEGKVTKSTGSWYIVKAENGSKINCRIRGKFRIEGLNLTNPIAVGDIVNFDLEDEDTGIIHEIKKRRNYIIRKAASNSRQDHIVAANLDQAILVATLKSPTTPIGFIDRFLLTAEVYDVPPILIFNKTDIYDQADFDYINELIGIYNSVGYPSSLISAITGEGFDKFEKLISNKTSLIAGNSGVGKSTILNRLTPDLDLKVQKISGATDKGVHTTTFAEMYDLPKYNANIIDTPGIKELGLVNIEAYEISHFFPEMRELIGQCKFNNCLHVNESKCAVKEAVDKNDIHSKRYQSYLNILENQD